MTDLPRADIRLGYLCNHNCMFCCVSEHRKENLSTADALKEIENAKKFGAEKLVFTGGEPTIRKDIVKLVEKGKELGFKDILIITNGQMCSYPEFLEKLVKAGLTSLCFSIPDYRQDVYEHLTQTKGSFERLMKGIENAKKHELLVSTITVINKLNYKELPKITEFLVVLSKHFKRFFSEFVFINPTDNAWKHREELVPKISEVAPYVLKSLDIAKEKGLALNVEAIPLCYMVGYFDHVVEMGMAKKRLFVQDGKSDDRYNERRVAEGKAKGKNCKDCEYNDRCEGVWKIYMKIYSDDELKNKCEKKKTIYHLVVTGKCNYNCRFCSRPDRDAISKERSKEEIKKCMNDIKEDVNIIVFTGGEPTLRGDLVELVHYAKTLGMGAVYLQTNGSRLIESDYVNKLKIAGLDMLFINLPAYNEQIFDGLTVTKGNLVKVIEGLKKVVEVELPFVLVVVINSLNYKNLLEMLIKVKESKLLPKYVQFSYLCSVGEVKRNEDLLTEFNRLIPELTNVLSFCISNMIRFELLNIPFCVLESKYWDQVIKADEDVEYVTNFGDRIKIESKGIIENENTKATRCKECRFNNICCGVGILYANKYGLSELRPVAEENIPLNNCHQFGSHLEEYMRLGNKDIEIISLFCGTKEVTRKVCKRVNVNSIITYYNQIGLQVSMGPYFYSTNIIDPDLVYIYISLSKSLSNRAKITEALIYSTEDTAKKNRYIKEFGLLLGYPACCIDSYNLASFRDSDHPYRSLLYSLKNTKSYNHWSLNTFLKGYSLITYTPCSFDCKESLDKSRLLFKVINEFNPNLACRIEIVLKYPVLYWNEYMGCSLVGTDSIRNRLHYKGILVNSNNDKNDNRLCYYDKKIIDQVRRGNSLILGDDKIQILQDEVPVGMINKKFPDEIVLLKFS